MADTDRNDFVWSVHSYLNEYIRFADAKAQIVVGWTSAVLGALLAAGVQKNFDWSGRGILTATGFGLLVGGFVFAIIAVTPRLTNHQLPGLIFWKHILAHKDRARYVTAMKATSDADLTDHVTGHIFDLAHVANSKFWWTGLAILLSFLGSLLSGAMYVSQ